MQESRFDNNIISSILKDHLKLINHLFLRSLNLLNSAFNIADSKIVFIFIVFIFFFSFCFDISSLSLKSAQQVATLSSYVEKCSQIFVINSDCLCWSLI